MNNMYLQIIMAGVGSLGFAIIFNVRKNKFPSIIFGGIISWVMYLLFFNITNDFLKSSFISSLTVCIYSELMARFLRAPANVILMPSIIPLLPGSAFYYTISNLLDMNIILFYQKGFETICIVLGITSGIVIGFFIFEQLIRIKTFFSIKISKSPDA